MFNPIWNDDHPPGRTMGPLVSSVIAWGSVQAAYVASPLLSSFVEVCVGEIHGSMWRSHFLISLRRHWNDGQVYQVTSNK